MTASKDPRTMLLNDFESLLRRAIYVGHIPKRLLAAHSSEAYLDFRKQCSWTLPAESAAHDVAADPRVTYYGQLYLALAVHFAKSGRSIGLDELDGFVAPEKPPTVTADESSLARAMTMELRGAARVLRPQRKGDAQVIAPAVDALSRFAEQGWQAVPDSPDMDASVDAPMLQVPRELAHSLGNVAIAYERGDSSSADNSDQDAEIAPLHLWLVRVPQDPSASVLQANEGSPFRVYLFPSLLSALDLYSSLGSSSTEPGWWQTLDLVEKWATDEYARTLAATAPSTLPLTGTYLARWHVARSAAAPAANDRSSCYSGVVRGPSHGAAFAMGLLQAIARAQLAEQPR